MPEASSNTLKVGADTWKVVAIIAAAWLVYRAFSGIKDAIFGSDEDEQDALSISDITELWIDFPDEILQGATEEDVHAVQNDIPSLTSLIDTIVGALGVNDDEEIIYQCVTSVPSRLHLAMFASIWRQRGGHRDGEETLGGLIVGELSEAQIASAYRHYMELPKFPL